MKWLGNSFLATGNKLIPFKWGSMTGIQGLKYKKGRNLPFSGYFY